MLEFPPTKIATCSPEPEEPRDQCLHCFTQNTDFVTNLESPLALAKNFPQL